MEKQKLCAGLYITAQLVFQTTVSFFLLIFQILSTSTRMRHNLHGPQGLSSASGCQGK